MHAAAAESAENFWNHICFAECAQTFSKNLCLQTFALICYEKCDLGGANGIDDNAG